MIQLLLGYDDAIKDRLLSSRPMLKPFRPVEMRSSDDRFGGNGGLNLRYWFRNPQKALS